MADVALVTTAIAGLVVSVGALLVSIGVLYLVMRIGNAIDNLTSGSS